MALFQLHVIQAHYRINICLLVQFTYLLVYFKFKSKFSKGCGVSKLIDGLTDEESTAEAFAEHSRKTCTSFNEDQNTRLQSIYQNRRQNYVGDPFLDKHKFDAGDIEASTAEMKRGKAAGLDELTIEHLVHSHPVLFAI